MAVVTFDGANQIITEISAAGDNSLTIEDIYSDWKDFVVLSSGFLPAFSVIGGDPITATQNVDSYFFLENGWRIRPAELSHKLTVVGNLFTREEGESAFVDTLGSFNVNTETLVTSRSLVNEVVTLDQVRDIVQQVVIAIESAEID